MKVRCFISLIMIISLMLTACSKQGDESSLIQQTSSEVQPPLSSSSVDGEARLPDYGAEFLEKAHSMGYTNKQLEYLKNSEIPEDKILNLSASTSSGISTPDGRYILSGYEVNFLVSIGFLFDTETNEATVLADWENGYLRFGFLNDELFYASIPQVGGADYEAGVRFYNVASPNQPYAVWNLTDSKAENEMIKILFSAYPIDSTEMLLAFWCETPKAWGGWVEEDTQTYRITLINYDGDVIKELDTGILLGSAKTGIAGPSFDKPNSYREAKLDTVYFDIGGISYEFNYQSYKVSKI